MPRDTQQRGILTQKGNNVKIVLNTNYGGFSLPTAAYNKYAELKGLPLDDTGWGTVYPSDIDRTDPMLVDVVEHMRDKGDLEVLTLRPGAYYRIHEYDGAERIEYRDDIDWDIAE